MMKTFAIVPAKKFENAKARLSSMLSADDRIHLSSLMLDDTLSVLGGVQQIEEVVVVSSDKRAGEIAARYGAKFLHEQKESGVNPAVKRSEEHTSELQSL